VLVVDDEGALVAQPPVLFDPNEAIRHAGHDTRDGEAPGNAGTSPFQFVDRATVVVCTGWDQLPADSLGGGLVGFHQVGPRGLT
ncbi:MAG TPA: hypothetical protein VLR27_12515, partial [Acidimicrobiales bacterium]|nr:hypothetical protein [Acidimicrobiales bacterium]